MTKRNRKHPFHNKDVKSSSQCYLEEKQLIVKYGRYAKYQVINKEKEPVFGSGTFCSRKTRQNGSD